MDATEVPNADRLRTTTHEATVSAYHGVAATGYETTLGSQFIVVAKNLESLRVAWGRLMSVCPLDESKVKGVVVMGTVLFQQAMAEDPQPAEPCPCL
jgi:hypothetical protein